MKIIIPPEQKPATITTKDAARVRADSYAIVAYRTKGDSFALLVSNGNHGHTWGFAYLQDLVVGKPNPKTFKGNSAYASIRAAQDSGRTVYLFTDMADFLANVHNMENEI